MANALYSLARESFLKGEISWSSGDIRVILADTGVGAYTPDLAVHQFLHHVPVGARIAVSAALANKTTTNGTADADDVVLSAVAGVQSEVLVLYQHEAIDTETTSRLIGLIDIATGLPVTPNGGDITIAWHANGIFTL